MPLSCSTRSSESIVLSQYNASDQVDGRTVGEHTDLINGLLALKKKCTLENKSPGPLEETVNFVNGCFLQMLISDAY